MTTRYFVAFLACAAASQPALAQNVSSVEGPRVEVRAGLDRVRIAADYDDGVDSFSGADHEDGVIFGGEFGYDRFVASNFTLGAYAGADFSTTDYCTEVFGNDEACLDAGRNITIGLRAGTSLTPNIFAYVKGGYSNGRVTARYEDFDNIIDDFEISDNRDGFHLGAGLETRLANNVYGKIEYVFTDYSDFGDDFGGFSYSVEPSRHQLTTGIGIRF